MKGLVEQLELLAPIEEQKFGPEQADAFSAIVERGAEMFERFARDEERGFRGPAEILFRGLVLVRSRG